MQALLAAVLVLAVAGCSATSGTRSGIGTATTALAPGLPSSSDSGRRIESRIIGAMGGGLIGRSMGVGLDAQDRRRALEAEYRALEYTPGGQPVTWKGQSSGRSGEVIAAQPYSVGSQNCRQYIHTVYVGLEPQSARGTACRNSDGSWTPLT